MKIGNIKEMVSKIAEKYRTISVDDSDYYYEVERSVRRLPKEMLEKFFQERFNKHLDYDQWVGIRDTLDDMGNKLYASTLAVIGDSIFVIQSKNEEKIQELESEIKTLTKEKEKLQEELKKYVD